MTDAGYITQSEVMNNVTSLSVNKKTQKKHHNKRYKRLTSMLPKVKGRLNAMMGWFNQELRVIDPVDGGIQQ